MIIGFWIFLFCVFKIGSANTNNEVEKVEKEPRFLPLFDLKRYHPARPPHQHQAPSPPLISPSGPGGYGSGRCTERLESALEQLKRRKRNNKVREDDEERIDTPSYTHFQKMRSLPADMYVTRMRVRLPQNTDWVRVEKCFFDPRNGSLDTKLLFHDITISGNVDLYDPNLSRRTLSRRHIQEFDDYRSPVNRGCNMILRIRKAGIGFHTRPLHQAPGKFNVKTDSEFIEPGFISVYAYGCERYIHMSRKNRNTPLSRRKRSIDEFAFDTHLEEPELDGRSLTDQWDTIDVVENDRLNYERSKLFRPDEQLDEAEEISREMEDIFTKGIRTLLTTYMKKELQPAIKETLVRNLGYVISYG